MKRILLIALLAVSALASAQLKEGQYQILLVSGYSDGKILYCNMVDNVPKSYVTVTPTIVSITIAGYGAYTFSNVTPKFDGKDTWMYITKMIDNGNIAAFNYYERGTGDNKNGYVTVLRSDNYADIFAIDLDKK